MLNSTTGETYTKTLTSQENYINGYTNVIQIDTREKYYDYLLIESKAPDYYFKNIWNSNYSQAYNLGFNDAVRDNQTTINTLNTQITNLNQELKQKIIELRTLQEHYNAISNKPLDINMRNLIWYIAETPFTSFKNIWNVDFLGLNIASFITGLLTIFVVLYIIKKIF